MLHKVGDPADGWSNAEPGQGRRVRQFELVCERQEREVDVGLLTGQFFDGGAQIRDGLMRLEGLQQSARPRVAVGRRLRKCQPRMAAGAKPDDIDLVFMRGE